MKTQTTWRLETGDVLCFLTEEAEKIVKSFSVAVSLPKKGHLTIMSQEMVDLLVNNPAFRIHNRVCEQASCEVVYLASKDEIITLRHETICLHA